ncbi:SUMF1/EgtB/PvdO family nonheme iron enzyme [Bradyrhizobium sp.]|uniref:SUMF1/EgtB/PvdO family nonheme iron enzyme n=1 Tax=Bradyrhizobium sp. TaxID=376 RepID=UPI001DB1D8AB|nr:SUMF1/EgtB/PvdO family nonheme iron enzyme [Bradyrhizobium sp.]MBI5320905.1 SUMF1/EgtB/PvdO family nonheme iron enzyme [Bradyrhizobium sp.]
MLIAFKLKLALACVAGLAGPLAVAPLLSDAGIRGGADGTGQAIVEVRAGNVSYRVAGDFTRNGRQAAAPLRHITFQEPLAIMKHQVSSADYQACVDAGACRSLDRGVVIAPDRPAVQVSWHDANAYAGWLSRKTGEHYRLPTDEEWAFAAGSRFSDDGLPVDNDDPSKRWIARYERESERKPGGGDVRAFGSFGINENGLADLAGNVWEWTSTCFTRHRLDDAGETVSARSNCGVRVVQGQHRSYVTDFIRDARAGGCAAGVPPDNLGFRLVREPQSWVSAVAKALHIARG